MYMGNTLLSLEDISKIGEEYYNSIRADLEKTSIGQYVVVDVEERDYTIDADRLKAIVAAEAKFGQKLFYITQVGARKNPSVNFSAKKDYAWNI